MPRPMKSPPPTHEEFVFWIREPSLSYGFMIEHDRRRREERPFDEREAVHFVTECIWPDRFKGREGKATLYPEPDLLEPEKLADDDVHRKWIGHIRCTKAEFEPVLWLPPPACWRLAQAMASGLIRSMGTNGLVETKGLNRVTSVSFHGVEFDPVAYVG